MSFNFEIKRVKYGSICELWFQINDKKYDFKFNVYTPDCDDYSENLNAHYFTFADTNKFGAKSNYLLYINKKNMFYSTYSNHSFICSSA